MAVERIACLLASGTEIVCGLGLGDRIVAISHECDYPAAILDRPRVTRTRINDAASSVDIDQQVRDQVSAGTPIYEIDVEQLASLRPDLIVTQAQCEVCAVSYDDVVRAVAEVDGLRGTGVVSLNPTTLEGVFADILAVGAAADCADAANGYVDSLRLRVEAVRAKAHGPADDQRLRVACIEWVEPLMVAANWVPDMIELAGGRSGMTIAGEHTSYSRWADLVGYDPEVLVVAPCGFDLARGLQEAAELESLPGWGDLSAVRERRVFAVDGKAYFNRSGPRLVESLEMLGQFIRADLPANGGSCWQRIV